MFLHSDTGKLSFQSKNNSQTSASKTSRYYSRFSCSSTNTCSLHIPSPCQHHPSLHQYLDRGSLVSDHHLCVTYSPFFTLRLQSQYHTYSILLINGQHHFRPGVCYFGIADNDVVSMDGSATPETGPAWSIEAVLALITLLLMLSLSILNLLLKHRGRRFSFLWSTHRVSSGVSDGKKFVWCYSQSYLTICRCRDSHC